MFPPFLNSLPHLQEGLTPEHLKKAKLIFFYSRYPNANTLKSYFPDVKVIFFSGSHIVVLLIHSYPTPRITFINYEANFTGIVVAVIHLGNLHGNNFKIFIAAKCFMCRDYL